MKKLLALALVGAMMVSVPVMAADSPTAAVVASDSSSSSSDSSTESSTPAATTAANTVATAPGNADQLPTTLPAGGVAINGEKSSQKISLTQATTADVAAGKEIVSETPGAKLISTFGTTGTAAFENAAINLTIKGLKPGSKVAAYALINGKKIPITTLAYSGHVITNLPGYVKVFIVEYPAGVAAPAYAVDVAETPADGLLSTTAAAPALAAAAASAAAN